MMNSKRFKRKSSGMTFNTSKNLFFWIVVSVMIIAPFSLWWLYVNWRTIFYGFQEFDITGDYTWGLGNFEWVFQQIAAPESELRLGIINTFKFWIWDACAIFPLTYLTSIFLYKKVKGYKVFKFIFFLPSIISSVILTSFFKFALQDGGPFMILVSKIAGEDLYLFQNSDTALQTLMAYNMWTFGSGFIMWVASFSRIPEEVLEYARIDGVNWWQEMIYMIFPLSTGYFFLRTFLLVLGIFNAGAPILLLTRGAYNTMTISYWQFINTLDTEVSQARVAAFGVCLSCISIPLSLIVRKITNKFETVEY